MNILRSVADLFVAKSCFGCGAPSDEPLCTACNDLLPYLSAPFCDTCGYPTMDPVRVCRQCRGRRLYFKQSRSLLAYESAARKLLLTIKMQSSYGLVDLFICKAFRDIDGEFWDIDAVTYIPETFIKKMQKKHNSSELIARAVSHYANVPVINALKVTKKVADQASLKLEERKANLKGAFVKRDGFDSFEGKLMIVDDVFTTGSTINEASRALSSKSTLIKAFTLARTL